MENFANFPVDIDELARTVSELLFTIPNIDGKRRRFPVDMVESGLEARTSIEAHSLGCG